MQDSENSITNPTWNPEIAVGAKFQLYLQCLIRHVRKKLYKIASPYQ
jgi:hypothetical protein